MKIPPMIQKKLIKLYLKIPFNYFPNYFSFLCYFFLFLFFSLCFKNVSIWWQRSQIVIKYLIKKKKNPNFFILPTLSSSLSLSVIDQFSSKFLHSYIIQSHFISSIHWYKIPTYWTILLLTKLCLFLLTLFYFLCFRQVKWM